MAETTVEVVARAVGFEKLAADAERAAAAFKNLAAATKGANVAGGAAAKQLSEDMARVVNGLPLGQKLGTQMRQGMAAALSNQGFWTSTFNGIASRFQTFGKTVGKSMALGVQAGWSSLRSMNGGHGPTHTDYIGGALIGGLTFKGIEEITKAAADRQSALFRLAATKLATGKQRQVLSGLAEDWSRQFGNISTTEGIDLLKDSLQIFGGTHELFGDHGNSDQMTPEGRAAMTRIAGLLSYSKTYQAASGHEGNSEAIIGQFASAIRSGEIKGLGSNPTDLANWVEKLTKIQLATGVDPTTFLQAQRAAGLSFLTMNDDAIYKFATMVQENKQRAGVMAATSFMHMVGGGSQTKRSNEMMRKLGFFGDDKNVNRLANEGKLELNKNGEIKHINDTSIIPNNNDFAQDQYKWYAETLYPAVRAKLLKDKGIDIGDTSKPPSQRTLDEIANVMRELGATFKNRNEANQAAESVVQAPQIERRAQLARKVQIEQDAANDLIVKQTMDYAAQMNNLKVELGKTILPTITGFLKGLTGVMQDFADFTKAHPDLTGNLLKYGGGALLAGGGLAGIGLFMHLAKLPLQILKSLAITGGYILGGTGIGALNMVGGAASLAAMGQTSGRVKAWIGAVGTVRTVLGDVVRLMGLLGKIFMAYEVGKWAINTETGGAMYEQFKKELDAIMHPGTSHGKEQLNKKSYWQNDRIARQNLPWLAAITTPVAYPEYLRTLIGDRAKYVHYARRNGPNSRYSDYWNHLRQSHEPLPANAYLGWTPVNRGGGPNVGGQKSGPVPVIVQSMPKGQDRPNNVTTNVTVNVTTNASAQDIGGAVGSAVGSKVSNALSDQHH